MVIPLRQLLRIGELYSGSAQPCNVHEDIVLAIVKGEGDPSTDWYWFSAEAFLRWELGLVEEEVARLDGEIARLEAILDEVRWVAAQRPEAVRPSKENLPNVRWDSTPSEFENFWVKWRDYSDKLTIQPKTDAELKSRLEDLEDGKTRLRREIAKAEKCAQSLGNTRSVLLKRFPVPPGVPIPEGGGDRPWENLLQRVPSADSTDEGWAHFADKPEHSSYLWPAVPEGWYEQRQDDDDSI